MDETLGKRGKRGKDEKTGKSGKNGKFAFLSGGQGTPCPYRWRDILLKESLVERFYHGWRPCKEAVNIVLLS